MMPFQAIQSPQAKTAPIINKNTIALVAIRLSLRLRVGGKRPCLAGSCSRTVPCLRPFPEIPPGARPGYAGGSTRIVCCGSLPAFDHSAVKQKVKATCPLSPFVANNQNSVRYFGHCGYRAPDNLLGTAIGAFLMFLLAGFGGRFVHRFLRRRATRWQEKLRGRNADG